MKTKWPVPLSVSIEGLKPGETPVVVLRYALGADDAALEALLGVAFAQAKEASTDGTVTVVYE